MLFALLSVIWGIPYLLIKVAVREIAPGVLVFARTAIGAMLLVPIAAARSELRPVVARWRPLVAFTVAELAIPWVLLSQAERRLPSSLTGLLVAVVPLLGALLSWLFGRESIGKRGLAGLVVGLAGVALVVGFDVSRGDSGSAAMMAAVVVGYAAAPLILARKLADLPQLGVVSASLALCAVGFAPYGLTHLPSHLPPTRVLAAVAGLGVVCTALAFVLFSQLIRAVGPVRATVITYFNPLVAVALGVIFLHESFSIATGAGFLLILAGSFVASGSAGDTPKSAKRLKGHVIVSTSGPGP